MKTYTIRSSAEGRPVVLSNLFERRRAEKYVDTLKKWDALQGLEPCEYWVTEEIDDVVDGYGVNECWGDIV